MNPDNSPGYLRAITINNNVSDALTNAYNSCFFFPFSRREKNDWEKRGRIRLLVLGRKCHDEGVENELVLD